MQSAATVIAINLDIRMYYHVCIFNAMKLALKVGQKRCL